MKINTIASTAEKSVASTAIHVKNAVMVELDLTDMIQIDSHKWVFPVNCDNGTVMYAEIAISCKKEGYDVESAHNEYVNKVKRTEKIKRERIENKWNLIEQLKKELGE